MTTIGFIGAGHIGAQIARAVTRAGYSVVLSNSGDLTTLETLVSELGSNARAAHVEDAAASSDLIIVAIPEGAFSTIPAEPLAGKTVAVTSNYNRDREGAIPEIDEQKTTIPGLLQRHLPGSHVVRAFSHISSAELTTDGKPEGASHRRALAVAGDNADAKRQIEEIYNAVGFDSLDLGPLDESWRIDRGQPAFIAHLDLDHLKSAAARADRSRSI